MAHSTFTKQKDGTGGSVSLQKCPKRAEAHWLLVEWPGIFSLRDEASAQKMMK